MEDQTTTEATQSTESQPLFGTSAEVLKKYNKCVICQSFLNFQAVTDFSRNLTQETAKCPECNIKVRHVTHRLQ